MPAYKQGTVTHRGAAVRAWSEGVKVPWAEGTRQGVKKVRMGGNSDTATEENAKETVEQKKAGRYSLVSVAAPVLVVVAAAEDAAEDVTADESVETDALTLSDATEEVERAREEESPLERALEVDAALDSAVETDTEADALAEDRTVETELAALEAEESWELSGPWASVETARTRRAHKAESLAFRRRAIASTTELAWLASTDGPGKARRTHPACGLYSSKQAWLEKAERSKRRRACHGASWGPALPRRSSDRASGDVTRPALLLAADSLVLCPLRALRPPAFGSLLALGPSLLALICTLAGQHAGLGASTAGAAGAQLMMGRRP